MLACRLRSRFLPSAIIPLHIRPTPIDAAHSLVPLDSRPLLRCAPWSPFCTRATEKPIANECDLEIEGILSRQGLQAPELIWSTLEGHLASDRPPSIGCVHRILSYYKQTRQSAPISQLIDKIFKWISSGRMPSEPSVFNSLMEFTLTTPEARLILDGLLAKGLAPDIATMNNLARVACDVDEANAVIDLMGQHGILPDIESYSYSTQFIQQKDEFYEIVAEIRSLGLPLNSILYSKMMQFCESKDEAIGIVIEMETSGVEIGRDIYEHLLRLSHTKDEATAILDDIVSGQGGHLIDKKLLRILLSFFRTIADINQLQGQMVPFGLDKSESIYAAKIRYSPGYEAGLQILAEMERSAVHPSQMCAMSLLNHATDFEHARAVIGLLERHGIVLDPLAFDLWSRYAVNEVQRAAVVAEGKRRNLVGETAAYNTYINAACDQIEARYIFDRMCHKKIPINTSTYVYLIENAASLELAGEIVEDMVERDIRLDNLIYTALAKKCRSLQQLVEVVAEMDSIQLRPDLIVYDLWLRFAPDASYAVGAVLQHMESVGRAELDAKTYTEALRLAANKEDARKKIRRMEKSGLTQADKSVDSLRKFIQSHQ
eukprot:TRINITY_DN3715_c0_g2_i1.p1 TRINITY_DN3715_c0_g2~~TRINITY_DN3715_c0_g2_i1.p1  ORF type:complete len:602 (-),score=212.65 TRINITY_DN3715_c0_g2_i1:65-1870(-)